VTDSLLDDPPTPCCCHVTREGPGRAVVLEVLGIVDGTAAGVLLPACDEAVRSAGRSRGRLVLDLAGVEHIAPTGVAGLVSVLAWARTHGHPVVACGLSEHSRRVFATTRLSDYVELHPHRAAALAKRAPRRTRRTRPS
jgi:anti-anti-sigma factor